MPFGSDFDDRRRSLAKIAPAAMAAFVLLVRSVVQSAHPPRNIQDRSVHIVRLTAHVERYLPPDPHRETRLRAFRVPDRNDPTIGALLEQLFQHEGRIAG